MALSDQRIYLFNPILVNGWLHLIFSSNIFDFLFKKRKNFADFLLYFIQSFLLKTKIKL